MDETVLKIILQNADGSAVTSSGTLGPGGGPATGPAGQVMPRQEHAPQPGAPPAQGIESEPRPASSQSSSTPRTVAAFAAGASARALWDQTNQVRLPPKPPTPQQAAMPAGEGAMMRWSAGGGGLPPAGGIAQAGAAGEGGALVPYRGIPISYTVPAAGSVAGAAEAAGGINLAAAFGLTALAAAALTVAFKKASDYFIQRGEYLKRYSLDIQEAGARAQVRTIRSDIREAQELGPGIARLTDATSRMENAFREFMLPIKKFLLTLTNTTVTPIVEGVAESVEMLNDILAHLGFAWDELKDLLTTGGKNMEAIFDKFSKDLAEARDKNVNPFLHDFMKLEHGLPNIARPPDVIERAAAERLNVPLFQGK